MASAPSPCGLAPLLTIGDGRGNRIAIDRVAFAANVAATRALIGPGVRIFQVVKGDGYGLGLERTVAMGQAAGVDGFCAGTPEEALRIRVCAPAAFVLLFTACAPEQLPQLAQQGVVVSINSVEAFAALAQSGIACRAWLDLDCGFGRFGLGETALNQVLDLAARHPGIAIEGAYTHFGQSDDATLDRGLALFARHRERLRRGLEHPLTTMVAATHTILSRPTTGHDAVDPGRLLYGIVDGPARDRFRPVLSAISSRLIQVNRIAEAQAMTIGYGEQVALPAGGTTGVFPLGWHDGLSLRGGLEHVLVHGRRVPVIARTLLHSIVDVSDLDNVRVGDEVVLVGVQGAAELTLDDQAAGQGVTATELHFRLAGAITRAALQTTARVFAPAHEQ